MRTTDTACAPGSLPLATAPAIRGRLADLAINGVPIRAILGYDPASDSVSAYRAVEVGLGYCHVCGQRASFYGYEPIDFPCKRNSFVCQNCGSCGRNRHIAKCIVETILTEPASHSLRDFADHFRGRVFQTCTSGAIAEALQTNPGFVASEYIDGAVSGEAVNGVLCQDLHATTFEDCAFDLVITEDVLEHVAEPRRAFTEIRRILRPGGYHIGTIPVNWARDTTVTRAIVEDRQIRHLMEPEYHGDPTRPGGILAFTEFGQDITDVWCGIIGPSRVDTAHQDLAAELAYGIYNSWVFISRKESRNAMTDVARIPASPRNDLSSIKRQIKHHWAESPYYDLVEGQEYLDVFWGNESPFKVMFDHLELEAVVELACGHGRHSAQVLRQSPRSSLVLVDVNENNIVYCKERFAGGKNVQCHVNSGTDIACCADGSATAIFSYDAMVHFEYDDVAAYLREIFRVLRPGGRALLHHSNNSREPGKTYSECVHWRNFMSTQLFNHMAARAGLAVVDQKALDWDGAALIDAVTLLQRPL
jgi:ubiquinone/menaquinone biosynthesis C-methylase UbiE